jgi:hypothetical protein
LKRKCRAKARRYKKRSNAILSHVQMWVNSDVVGIDVGITLLSAENLRSGFVWRWFNRSPDILRAKQQLFHAG